MKQNFNREVNVKLKQKRRRKTWRKFVNFMTCVVVFCTTYALILPAITMETDSYCGIEPHAHTDACYQNTLLCEIHVHTDECYRKLDCTLPETDGHSHTEECVPPTENVFVCGQEEHPAHVHTEECEPRTETLLSCVLEEAPGHSHTEACFLIEQTVSCGLTETEGHIHSDQCHTTSLVCSLEEGEDHAHTADCFIDQLTCGQEEQEGHTHTDACFSTLSTNVCGLEEQEGHTHTDGCYTTVTVYGCNTEETAGHIHSDSCTAPASGYICGLEEVPAHTHTDECYTVAEELMCTIPADAEHNHGDACYDQQLICTQEEHEHGLACYANPEADLENPEIWERTLPGSLSGQNGADLLEVAKSQLGYTESTTNYIVTESGEAKGYTRYGAWYGNPYGDWNAMFVSFCLHYAKVDAMPIESSCSDWVNSLRNAGMYASAVDYTPKAGDIIFLDRDADGSSDHTGIVAEYFPPDEHNVARLQCIEGNCNNTVCYTTYNQADPDILGYGLLPGQERFPVTVKDPEEEVYQINTDIKLGPVVILTAEEMASEEDAEGSIMMFALAPRSTTDLKEYLGRDDVQGSFFLTLTDDDDKPLPKDENGNFIVEPDTPYELTLTVDSPYGFAPGSYTYQLPAGLDVQAGSGELVAKDKLLGTWSIDENGLITLAFNEDADNYTNAMLSAKMGIQFQASDTIIEFDGDIKVVIKEPPEEEETDIEIFKWGGPTEGMPYGTSLTWQIRIVGHEGANIAGTVVTDSITSVNHYYTDQNKANTIHVNATYVTATGETIWHDWIVSAGDCTWTETGWQYTMPSTVTCRTCNQKITLADEWTYDFYYTSTPVASDMNITEYYTNHAEFGGHEANGIATIKYGTGPMGVKKSGHFQGDAEGGKFVWTVAVQLPGMSAGQKAVYDWHLTDGMNVKDANGQDIEEEGILKPHNDMDRSVVTITRNGVTATLNRIENATDSDEIVWHSEDAGVNGYIQHITFYCRCHCTEATCSKWQNGTCGEEHMNGFCRCWTIQDDVEIVFTYTTDASTIIEYYGEIAKSITNLAELWHSGGWQSGSSAEVKIPSLFEKTLTDPFTSSDPNHPEKKYIASYTITLNEAKQDLSPNGTPITIIDEMTDSLIYVAGSMVITAEDADGNTQVLTEGTDYTIAYDGSDREDDLHVLTIELKHPQPAMYTLKYDTSIHIKGDLTSAIPYQNWAKVTIRGKNLTADTEQRLYADINYTAKSYQVDIVKTAAGTDVPLPGATFGLYNQAGGLITSQTTDENGELTFITSITDGIILLEHEPYYIQEINAPEGYVLDQTKYWFYFCDQGEGCAEGSVIQEQHRNAVSIPGDQIHTFNMKNIPKGYELPETGGSGIFPYTMAGLLMMLTSTAFLVYKTRRREAKHTP